MTDPRRDKAGRPPGNVGTANDSQSQSSRFRHHLASSPCYCAVGTHGRKIVCTTCGRWRRLIRALARRVAERLAA